MNNLTDEKYWEKVYKNHNFKLSDKNDPIRRFIEKNLTNYKGTCFEIGCYPGTYLSIFGELGCELNGIDFIPELNDKMVPWLKSQGFIIGTFKNCNFLMYTPENKYDIVCSFGFIEHFDIWEEVFTKHSNFVKDGGYLIVTTPNFLGCIQRLLHRLVDNENLQNHNLCAMVPDRWTRILRDMNYDIIYTGYFGNYLFWVEENIKKNILESSLLIMIKIINKIIKPIFVMMDINIKSFSPFCGIIAKKRN